jgi:hypothetical protein
VVLEILVASTAAETTERQRRRVLATCCVVMCLADAQFDIHESNYESLSGRQLVKRHYLHVANY